MTNEEKVWALTNMRYDAGTGTLERKLKGGRWKMCSQKPVRSGYATAGVLGETLYQHRIAWLLAHGDIDDGLKIDHINGNRTDNRLCNLRLVTARENQQNFECHRDGRLVGAYWNKAKEKWRSQIYINGEQRYLGSFSTEQEAHQAYLNACEQLAAQF